MFFILPLGVSGLTLLDVDPHLYERIGEVSLSNTVSFTEDPAGSGTYRIDNLPGSSPVIRRTLVAEYPMGVGYSFVWGGEQNGTPETVIIPVREAGLVTSDFNFTVYKNGVSQNIVLAVGPSLQANGDYPVSGWPVEATGAEWILVWSRVNSGIFNFYNWKEFPLAPTGTVISCSGIHPPYDIGVEDGTQRSYFSCNYALKLDRLFQFDRAFAKYLESEGFGVLNDDPNLSTGTIYYGRTVSYPTQGQVILLIPQSGYSSLKTNDNGQITRPVLQVLVFDNDRNTAQTLSNQIFAKLDLMANETLPSG